MKIGMNLYLWLNRLQPEHFPGFATLKKAGFDGVEIPTGDYSPKEISAINKALNDEGLACTVATLLPPEFNPISDQKKIRTAAIHKLRRDIDVAQSLNAEALIGPIHSGHKLFYDRGPNSKEFDRCVNFLQLVGEQAQQASIVLAVEPLNRFECYFLNTAEQAKALIDAVDLPNVGVLYDTHHANIEENSMQQSIALLGPRINHFHVSESHRGTPGTGSVDWSNSFSALKEINYQGWLVIEAFATDVPGIPEAVNIWRNCFKSKQEVFEQGYSLIQQGMQN